jgi:hypothetical protein
LTSEMPQNFIDCDREQAFLLPPSLRDWLVEDHLAWFVIDAVERMDLAAFYAAYRADGHGRAAYEPAMMVSQFGEVMGHQDWVVFAGFDSLDQSGLTMAAHR